MTYPPFLLPDLESIFPIEPPIYLTGIRHQYFVDRERRSQYGFIVMLSTTSQLPYPVHASGCGATIREAFDAALLDLRRVEEGAAAFKRAPVFSKPATHMFSSKNPAALATLLSLDIKL